MIPSSIFNYEMWCEEAIPTRLLWLVLMLLADDDGVVRCTRPYIHSKSGLTMTQVKDGIDALIRTKCKYGRIEEVDEGIFIPCYESLHERLVQHDLFLQNMRGITDGLDYRSRGYWLKQLGFTKYSDYLKSRMWQSVKHDLGDGPCAICGGKASNVHHSRYHRDDLVGATLENLHHLCGACHHLIEFAPDGRKHSLIEANEKMLQMIRPKPSSPPPPNPETEQPEY